VEEWEWVVLDLEKVKSPETAPAKLLEALRVTADREDFGKYGVPTSKLVLCLSSNIGEIVSLLVFIFTFLCF